MKKNTVYNTEKKSGILSLNQCYGFPGNAMQGADYGNSAPFYQPQQYQKSFPQQQMSLIVYATIHVY